MRPLHEEVKNCVMAADVLNGHDANCAAWIAAKRSMVNISRGARNSRLAIIQAIAESAIDAFSFTDVICLHL